MILPGDLARLVSKCHLMTETEWRNLGVQQSLGWVHYMLHAPEPHVLLFRRPLPQQQQQSTSNVDKDYQQFREMNEFSSNRNKNSKLCK